MGGKREEKKKLYKSKIIKAASKIFKQNGYKNTTIEQISKEAEVGVGTTYLYFKSKSELYRVTIENELNIENIEDIFKHIDYNERPFSQINKISSNLINVILKLDKSMIKEYIYSFLRSDLDESSLIYSIIISADNELKVGYKNILRNYKEKDMLQSNFDESICTDIIFNSVLECFYKYMSSENVDINEILKDLEAKIKFVIQPYEK